MVMKFFRYVGTDERGKNVKGTMEATSRVACIRLLDQKNIAIIKIEEYSNIFTKMSSISFGATINENNLIFFLKQLGSLLNAGIKLVDALEILYSQEPNKKVRKIYMALQQEVYNGNRFSASLELFPNDFPPMLVSMTEVGEATGDLGQIIVRTSDYFDKTRRNNKKIMSVVKSPAMYIIITVVIVIAMSMFVFPNFATTYSQFGAGELPILTVIFMKISEFLLAFWPILLGATVTFITAFIVAKKKIKSFRNWLDKITLKVPMVGSLLQMNAQIMIASTLSQLMSRGVNSIEALKITRKVSKNHIYQSILDDTIQNVQDGRAFALAFESSWAIDPIMSKMISTGERTGEVPKLMTNLAEFYDEIADSKVDKIKGVVQPVLMLFVYAVVACLMLAMMMPQLQMGTNLEM